MLSGFCGSIISSGTDCKQRHAGHESDVISHGHHRECHTLVAPHSEIAVAFYNLRAVDPYVLLGVFLLAVASWFLLRRR